MHTVIYLRIAAVLVLLTGVGHTAGTFMPIPADQLAVARTHALMAETFVPMPVGYPQSYADIFLGNNIAVIVFLLVSGLAYLVFAGPQGLDAAGKRLLLLNNIGMAVLAIVSALYFFPVPAIFTGLAAVLGLLALRR